MFLYYATICYVSIFCLTILDKINKKEIENIEDLQGYLILYVVGLLSKFYKVKRISTNTYTKYFKLTDIEYLDSDDEEDVEKFKCKLNIMLDNGNTDVFRLKIRNNEINIFDKKMAEHLNDDKILCFIENEDTYKQVNGRDILDNNLEEIIKFLKNELLYDIKLFLNIELINGNLKDSKIYDITFDIQKFFVAGNEILSKLFLKNLLKMKYNVELDDNYSLNIMTKDVEMFTLTNKQKINIIVDDESNDSEIKRLKYEIV